MKVDTQLITMGEPIRQIWLKKLLVFWLAVLNALTVLVTEDLDGDGSSCCFSGLLDAPWFGKIIIKLLGFGEPRGVIMIS